MRLHGLALVTSGATEQCPRLSLSWAGARLLQPAASLRLTASQLVRQATARRPPPTSGGLFVCFFMGRSLATSRVRVCGFWNLPRVGGWQLIVLRTFCHQRKLLGQPASTLPPGSGECLLQASFWAPPGLSPHLVCHPLGMRRLERPSGHWEKVAAL